jgi:murein DD-endopeptidase MepM/ murein hydrolase activator NlpD
MQESVMGYPRANRTLFISNLMGLLIIGFLTVSCVPRVQDFHEATNSPIPLAGETTPLELGNFSAELKAKGVHGGMVCITYDGNPQDLIRLSLTAFTLRQGKYIEISIPMEEVEGEKCFEITDAKYLSVSPNAQGGRLIIPEEPLTFRIEAISHGERQILNHTQEIVLGEYMQFPFLSWVYPEEVEPGCVADSHYRPDPYTGKDTFYPAWDIIPKPSKSYPSIVGTPVLAPVDGVYFLYNVPSESDEVPFGVNAIIIYSEDTGYLVNLTHEYDLMPLNGKWVMLEELSGKEVRAGEQIGVVGPKDWGSGIPHTHFQVTVAWVELQETTSTETIYRYLTNINHPNIDFLKENLFLDESINESLNNPPDDLATCQDYPWGEIVIPQAFPILIDGRDGDWLGYKPVLTDESGDSETDVMDFTTLYMTKDNHYLYLMVKDGEKPVEKLESWELFNFSNNMFEMGEDPRVFWESWKVSFIADMGVENNCGGSEWELQVNSEYPNEILIDGMVGCNETNGPQVYPAEYSWGDVLEVRILLAYLRNPPEIDVFHVEGYLAEGEGQYFLADEMR